MHEAMSADLAAWANFYVIAGSSAAALTGLMFVVLTLVVSVRPSPGVEGIRSYSTPTVVYFGTALLVSAILAAPWHVLAQPGMLFVVSGLVGGGYIGRVLLRILGSESYRPDLDELFWYTIIPLAAYITLAAAGISLSVAPTQALYALAAAALVLIFVGIHNAWDIVTYLIIEDYRREPSATSNKEP